MIKQKQVTLFIQELGTLLTSGVPMLEAFDILINHHHDKVFKTMLTSIKENLKKGYTLKQALSQEHPNIDSLVTQLIGAGEVSGTLDETLKRIATYRQKNDACRANIKTALLYPSTILSFSIFLVIFMLVFVVPKFSHMFESLNATLPLPTQYLLGFSHFISTHYIYLCLFILSSVTLSIFYKKRIVDCIFKLPLFNKIYAASTLARLTRTLGTSLLSGIPICEALKITTSVALNTRYQRALNVVLDNVQYGYALNTAMHLARVFPPKMIHRLRVAEKSGTTDNMLLHIAQEYEDQLDMLTKSLSKLVEPAMIITLGFIIGGLVITLYLPIFQLGNAI